MSGRHLFQGNYSSAEYRSTAHSVRTHVSQMAAKRALSVLSVFKAFSLVLRPFGVEPNTTILLFQRYECPECLTLFICCAVYCRLRRFHGLLTRVMNRLLCSLDIFGYFQPMHSAV